MTKVNVCMIQDSPVFFDKEMIRGEVYQSGHYRLNVQSDSWPEGFYFCQLETNEGREVKKIVLKR